MAEMEQLNTDKNRLNFFMSNWHTLKNELSKADLIFIVENMQIDHDNIIQDLEDLGEYYPTNEDIGFSD